MPYLFVLLMPHASSKINRFVAGSISLQLGFRLSTGMLQARLSLCGSCKWGSSKVLVEEMCTCWILLVKVQTCARAGGPREEPRASRAAGPHHEQG